MRVIVKEPGKLPYFRNVSEKTRTAAVREILGDGAEPAFFNLTALGSFSIAYDSHWMLTDEKLNFFASLPSIENFPVTMIFGTAVFMRTIPVKEYKKTMQDFEVANCGESEMEYIKSRILPTNYQFSLLRQLEKSLSMNRTKNTASRSIIEDLKYNILYWKEIHPETLGAKPLDSLVKSEKEFLEKHPTDERLKSKPFAYFEFKGHCKNLRLNDISYKNDVLTIRVNRNTYTVNMTNSYVESVSYRTRGETKSYELKLFNHNVFSVARYISDIEYQ